MAVDLSMSMSLQCDGRNGLDRDGVGWVGEPTCVGATAPAMVLQYVRTYVLECVDVYVLLVPWYCCLCLTLPHANQPSNSKSNKLTWSV